MLKYRLIHPKLLESLASSGHGDQILLADSNFPIAGKAPVGAHIVYLNVAPGILQVTQVLEILLDAINIERATMMCMDDGSTAPIAAEIRQSLPPAVSLSQLPRQEFYKAVSHPCTTTLVATGEQRLYANLLLTIGVVP